MSDFERDVREALEPPERFCSDLHRSMNPRCHACTAWLARVEWADDIAPRVAAALRLSQGTTFHPDTAETSAALAALKRDA